MTNVKAHHVDGYLRKVPGSSKKVRVKGHHVPGYNRKKHNK